MLNTDRDPIDPSTLAEAYRTLHDACQRQDADALETSAQHLLDALLEQGCLRPDEHVEAWIERIDGPCVVVEWGNEQHGLGIRPDGTTFLYD